MPNQKLPGFMFTYRDGGLTPIVLLPTTERLLIIGNALDGPVNTPVYIGNMSDAEAIFGPLTYTDPYINPATNSADGAYSGNTILKAIHESLLAGAGNIICVRVGGNTASATGIFSSPVSAYAIHPGRVYNSVSIVSASGGGNYTITLKQPTKKGGDITWVLAGTKTLLDLVRTVNEDVRNKTVRLVVPQASASLPIAGNFGVGTRALSGTTAGTNGTSALGEDFYNDKFGYYSLLTDEYGTFKNLITTEFEVAVLTGIYADDQVVSGSAATTTSIADKFAEFLYEVSRETSPCHGVIGLRPTGLSSPADLSAYADTALLDTASGYYDASSKWIKFGFFMNRGFTTVDGEESVDIGRYLSVVAGPDVVFSHRLLGTYLENGAAAYAGMIVNLPSQSATTNKPIGTIKAINGNFPKVILERLNQGVGRDDTNGVFGSAAYVTFKYNNVVGRPVVVSDNTCADRTSDYRTLQVLRIANLAASLTKRVLYPFIGEPNNAEAKIAMRTQLNSALSKMVEAGALLGGDGNGFKFAISSDPVETLIGQVTVTLFLRPALQIKFIQVVVNITA